MPTILPRVYLHEAVLRDLKRHPEIHREDFHRCLEQLLEGKWRGGLVVKKLRSSKKTRTIYEARLNRKYRILFTPVNDLTDAESPSYAFLLWGIVHHDDISHRARSVIPENAPLIEYPPIEEQEYKDSVLLRDVVEKAGMATPHEVFAEFGPQRWYTIDQDHLEALFQEEDPESPLFLTQEQKRILHHYPPTLVQGTSGSGKTTLSVYALEWFTQTDRVLYLTYHERLRAYAESLHRRLIRRVPSDPDVTITTFHRLVRQLLENLGEAHRFPPEKLVDFRKFRRITSRHPYGRNAPPVLLWEEIRGILKASPESEFLSLQDYLALGARKAPNFTDRRERRKVYQFATYYHRYLREHNLYDEADVTRFLLGRVRPLFDAVVVDEVQDFTELQIRLILDLSRTSLVFFVGDAQQSIHQSGFRWEDLKRLIYEKWQESPQVHGLTLNLRTGSGILRLANALLDLRQRISPERARLEGRYLSKEVARFFGDLPILVTGEEKAFLDRIPGGPDVAFLTRDLATKSKLRRLIRSLFPEDQGAYQVLTIEEVKGLEYPYVVLWKPTEAMQQEWGRLYRGESYNADLLWHELRYLYVALTRAREGLLIYEPQDTPFYQLPEVSGCVTKMTPQDLEAFPWQRKATLKDWERRGHYYMDHGLYEHARQCFLNADREDLVFLAQAYIERSEGRYNEAGALFARLQAWEQAAECYERAGNLEKAVAYYERIKHPKAMRLKALWLEEEEHWKEAADVWSSLGEHLQALRLYLRVRDPDGLYRSLSALQEWEAAGTLAEVLEDWDRAEEAYRVCGNESKVLNVKWKRAIQEGRHTDALEIAKQDSLDFALATAFLLQDEGVIWQLIEEHWQKQYGKEGTRLIRAIMEGNWSQVKTISREITSTESLKHRRLAELILTETHPVNMLKKLKEELPEDPVFRCAYLVGLHYFREAHEVIQRHQLLLEATASIVIEAQKSRSPLSKVLLLFHNDLFQSLPHVVQAYVQKKLGMPYTRTLAKAYVEIFLTSIAKALTPDISPPDPWIAIEKGVQEVLKRRENRHA